MTVTTIKKGTTDNKTAVDIASTTSFTTTTTTESKSTVMSPLETAATNDDDVEENNRFYDDDKCEVLYSVCVRNTNDDDDDDDENSIEVLNTKIKIGKLCIVNNVVFVIGSIFYVANACMPYGGLYNDGTLPASTLSPEAMLANATGDYDGEAWSDDNIALNYCMYLYQYMNIITTSSTYSILVR